MADFQQIGALIAGNRLGDARAALDGARKADPGASVGLFLDGVLSLREGNAAQALEKLGEAARRPDAKPNWALTYGFALDSAGRLDDAAREYEAAAARAPQLPEPWYCLGVVRAKQARWPDAEAAFGRSLACDPGRVEALHQQALARREQGRTADAIATLVQALAMRPNYVPGAKELALLYARAGRHAEAVATLEAVRSLAPRDPELLNNLGFSLQRENRVDDAIAAYRAALAISPGLAAAHCNLGTAHYANLDVPEAVASYQRALAIDPEYAEARVNLALAHYRRKDPVAMRAEAQRARASAQISAEALKNLGQLHRELGEWDDSVVMLREAVALDPGFAPASLALSAALLARGEWRDGWDAYRLRSTKFTHPVVRASPEAFRDEVFPEGSLAGRRYLLVDEQGVGDVVFFLRYAALLHARGAQLVYQGERRLISMLERTGLFVQCREREVALEPGSVAIMVPELPRLLGPSAGYLPPPPLPLTPDPARIAAARASLEAFGPAPWFGLTWRAGIRPKGEWIHHLFKEVPLPELGQAIAGARATWVSLQRLPDAGETEKAAAQLGVALGDLSALNDDLEGMLAVLSLLSGYVCVSNTNTHLFVSLGKQAHVLVPHPPEWRWLESGEGSPWFPGTGVYREHPEASWAPALARLRERITTEAAG